MGSRLGFFRQSRFRVLFMGKYDKLCLKIMSGQADANIEFAELCQLLRRLGFEEQIRGSHHRF